MFSTGIDVILDRIVTEAIEANPNKSEIEAAFTAVRLNLTVLTEQLVYIGLRGESLSNPQLYGLCSGLMETFSWMLAKEVGDMIVSDLEDGKF